MPPKRKAIRVSQSKAIFRKPLIEALHQTDGALDQEASNDIDDDTVHHHIPHTVNPNFTRTFASTIANPSQYARGCMGGFKGLAIVNIGQPMGSTVQEILHRNEENLLHCSDECKEASSLLRSTQSAHSDKPTSQRYLQQ
jgi:hypothetical protein